MMNNYAIIANNISKSFKLTSKKNQPIKFKSGYITPIDNISFKIEHGKMVGIIGKNGSGKTTLLRVIGGILSPEKGTIETSGRIGPLLQVGIGSNEDATVAENIITYGLFLGFDKKWVIQKIPEIVSFAELKDYTNVKMKHLSSGMKVRIMFSTAMLVDPDILLVDEIMSVGDLSFKQKSFEAFLSFKKRKKTIILVSHNLQTVKELCDEVIFLDNGKIIESGDPEKVINSYKQFCKK